MFEVGFTEIVLIFGIALLVLGPARLPKLAADLGRWAGRARAMARSLRTQLEQEAHQLDPLHTGTTPAAPGSADTARAQPAQAASGVPAPALPAAGSVTGGGEPVSTPSPAHTTTVPDERQPAG
jgi:Tat protein translocase TatB subunit